MTELSPHSPMRITRITIWLVGVSFVLFQFFLQLSSGIVIGAIRHEMPLSALMAGLLSSSLYIVYTILQIPVGLWFDRKNTRMLMAVNALICSLGCFLFAASHSFFMLLAGRVLIGTGAAFAFVGLSHVIREHFSAKSFAVLFGLSETAGFIITVIALLGMGTLITLLSWRSVIDIVGMVGLAITFACWYFIPDSVPSAPVLRQDAQLLKQIIKNKILWCNGLYVGFSFSIVTVFGALWSVPFLQDKLGCDLEKAGMLTSLFFLGTGFSCPLFGWLSNYVTRRKPLLLASCGLTTVLMLTLLYIPTQSTLCVASLMFLTGLCCGAYMLAYAIANELAPAHSLSTTTGFTNTLAVITTPLLQPLTGYFVDTFNNYQTALLVIPISLLIAGILVCFLPEKPIIS